MLLLRVRAQSDQATHATNVSTDTQTVMLTEEDASGCANTNVGLCTSLTEFFSRQVQKCLLLPVHSNGEIQAALLAAKHSDVVCTRRVTVGGVCKARGRVVHHRAILGARASGTVLLHSRDQFERSTDMRL